MVEKVKRTRRTRATGVFNFITGVTEFQLHRISEVAHSLRQDYRINKIFDLLLLSAAPPISPLVNLFLHYSKLTRMPESEDLRNLLARRPTWAEVDLDKLAANFKRIKQHVSPTARVMAVVKANAYGHGAVRCARRLAAEGADWFGVALPEEGLELRRAGVTQPVLSLGGFWEGQERLCLEERIAPAVYRLDMIEALDRAARERGAVADIHLKVDTGMGRLGVRYEQLGEFADALGAFKH